MIHVGIAIAILMGSLLLGVSIPFAFGAGTIYMYTMLGGTFATTLPVGFNGINTMVLLAIPTFIMAGGFIEKGKVGDELVSVVEMLVGRFRGGLMLAVSYASAIFGAICGSAAATCSCIGSIMAPKLKMAGYSKGLSAALISSSAPLGLLIPPSSLMIMYAWVSGESVLACFLSTVIPGVCLATLLGVVGMILAQREGVQPLENWVPIYSAPGLKKTWHATPALLLPVIILGGIYGGVMTPTEAACVSTLYFIEVAVCCVADRRRSICQRNEPTARGTSANARTAAGRDDTLPGTIQRPANASTKMCWVRRRRRFGKNRKQPWRSVRGWTSAEKPMNTQ